MIWWFHIQNRPIQLDEVYAWFTASVCACVSMGVFSYANCSMLAWTAQISFLQFCAFFMCDRHTHFLHQWNRIHADDATYNYCRIIAECNRIWTRAFGIMKSRFAAPKSKHALDVWSTLTDHNFLLILHQLLRYVFLYVFFFQASAEKTHTHLPFSRDTFFHFNCSLQTSQNIRLIAT